MSSVLNMLRNLWDFLGSNPGDRHFSSGERPGLKVLSYLNSHGLAEYTTICLFTNTADYLKDVG